MSISTPASHSPESRGPEALPATDELEAFEIEGAVFTFDACREELRFAIVKFKNDGVFEEGYGVSVALAKVVRQFQECVDFINSDSEHTDQETRIKSVCTLIVGEERDRLTAVAELAPMNKGAYTRYIEETLHAQVEAIYEGLDTDEERRNAVLHLFQTGLVGDMEITLNYFAQNRHALLRQWGALALATLDALSATRRALGNRGKKAN